MTKLIPIFYWNNSSNSYPDLPMPVSNKDFWIEVENKTHCLKAYFAKHLQHGLIYESYRGGSTCRLCKSYLGSSDLTDMVYRFPEKCEHYILEHDIIVSWEWIEHVINYRKILRGILEK